MSSSSGMIDLGRPTLMVDMDETLVYSRGKTDGSISFLHRGETCYVSLRPSAIPFLEAVKEKYNLRIVTQGIVEYQEEVLKACGIRQYFESLHGYLTDDAYTHRVDPGPVADVPKVWALIDNDPFPYIKFEWLGCSKNVRIPQLVNCKNYYGGGVEQGSLLDHLPALGRLLGV